MAEQSKGIGPGVVANFEMVGATDTGLVRARNEDAIKLIPDRLSVLGRIGRGGVRRRLATGAQMQSRGSAGAHGQGLAASTSWKRAG